MDEKTTVDPATVKAQWLAKLRSGEYEQGVGYLYERHRYCCLGVLCKVLGIADGVIERNDLRWPTELHRIIAKPDSVRLSHMNDAGDTFAKIADYIEAEVALLPQYADHE